MATYSFMKRFVPAVLNGSKVQTVRHVRKYPPEPGEELKLKCEGKIFGLAEITEVFPVQFHASDKPYMKIDGKILSINAEKKFSALDGISPEELKKFLRRYSPNKNAWNDFLVIRWKGFKKV